MERPKSRKQEEKMAEPSAESKPEKEGSDGSEVESVSHCLICPMLHPKARVLLREKVYLLGRDRHADLVLASDTVSRNHAKIEWEGGGFYIEDLGSKNGTQVNDALIERKVLEDSDLIVIGPFNIRFREFRGDINILTEVAKEDPEATSAILTAAAKSQVGLTGKFSELELFEICQLIEFNKKQGILTISGKEGSGEIHFHEGEIVAAEAGELKGKEAAIFLLNFPEGTFEYSGTAPRTEEDPPLITSQVLMEICRFRDESGLDETMPSL
jgi:pSer/pThr/pTyr-binding forkhead associated (FHA) protein